ncbi:GNAT family N-acetyltransferase [Candidatus Nomurabacteria bacterium]|nr:GNAT family N-acetyltransferase [Candidatus Nomurabacteria bacterium]
MIEFEKRERSVSVKIERVKPEDRKEYLLFVNEIPYNESVVSGSSQTQKYQVDKEQRRQDIENEEFAISDPDTEVDFVIKEDGKIVAAADAYIDDENPKEVYFSAVHVHPNSRQKGYAAQLSEAVEQWGREKKADYLRASISIKNPLSLIFFLSRGYIGKEVVTGAFEVVKTIGDEDMEVGLPNHEPVEVSMSDVKGIEELFARGLVLVDAKNVFFDDRDYQVADRQELAPEKWTLIFR